VGEMFHWFYVEYNDENSFHENGEDEYSDDENEDDDCSEEEEDKNGDLI
jgi:hypothetical protein